MKTLSRTDLLLTILNFGAQKVDPFAIPFPKSTIETKVVIWGKNGIVRIKE